MSMISADPETYDVFVIGGGVNGCGIARDAVGRGYSVALAEMHDLGSGTSSTSTKLIHGGLRYLEHYEFRLVRESLMEREVLWAAAPHIIHPMRFVLPYHAGLRPAWMLRLGLFLYDHIGGRKKLPATRVLDLRRDEAGKPLRPQYTKAFEYSDCWVNDARLVALNARDAADRGATILTRTKVVSLRREAGLWRIELERDEKRSTVSARLIVNAAGPWVDVVLRQAMARNNAANVRLVKGSHIVIRRKFEHERAYFFQNSDGRIFFAIPYEQEFTLIGTTDEDYAGDPHDVAISPSEIDYLCRGASEYFREPVSREDMVWSYSGVRPLFDDGASKAQEATRDYVLRTDAPKGEAACINIFGGKITTYRRLSESVMEEVGRHLGERGAPWTAGATLPGGDFPVEGFDALVSALRKTRPFLAPAHAGRLARLYGTRAHALLVAVRAPEDLGVCFGDDLYEVEVDYLMRHEWAVTAEDVLWRRTKRGLKLNADEAAALDAWMAERRRNVAAA